MTKTVKGGENLSFDLVTNLSPIIQGVIDIMPLFLDLVIAMVPVVITLAVSEVSIRNDVSLPVSRVLTRVLRQDPWHDQVLIRHVQIPIAGGIPD